MTEVSKIYINICPVCGGMDTAHFLNCKDYLSSNENFEIKRCQSCGFAFTQNFPSEKVIGRYYENPEYVSHSDTHKGLINRLYHMARKIALRSKAGIVKKYSSKESGLLLDVGSGTGYFLNKMREKKWVVTGIEKSEDARIYTKQKFDINCQDSDYLYQISPKTKDVISMWHVLEHLEHINIVMEHLHKILKDDGTLIIALPNKNSFDAEFYKEYWAAYDVPRHLWHFSPDDFKHLIDRHRFQLIDTKPMHFDTFYISMLSEKNKGTTLGSLVGLLRGGLFFLKSLNNKKRCSSLTYILKKKQ